MVFSSEPASQSKPKIQNLIAGSSDRPGSVSEETGEELGYEDCIGDNEPHENVQTIEIELISVMLRPLYRDMPTIVSLLATCKLIAPLRSKMGRYFPLMELEHLP